MVDFTAILHTTKTLKHSTTNNTTANGKIIIIIFALTFEHQICTHTFHSRWFIQIGYGLAVKRQNSVDIVVETVVVCVCVLWIFWPIFACQLYLR